jgi:hypothetical protein
MMNAVLVDDRTRVKFLGTEPCQEGPAIRTFCAVCPEVREPGGGRVAFPETALVAPHGGATRYSWISASQGAPKPFRFGDGPGRTRNVRLSTRLPTQSPWGFGALTGECAPVSFTALGL